MQEQEYRLNQPALQPMQQISFPNDNPLLQEAAQCLAAGDEIISRTLSGDSQRFLAATQQQGGQ